MNLKPVYFLFIFCCSFLCHSQSVTEVIDSLKNVLEKEVDLKKKAGILNDLAWEYRDIRPDSTLYYSKKANFIAVDNKFQREEIQSINYMGVAYRNLSLYSQAFEKYLEALRLSNEYEDEEQKGYSLINLGNLYLFQKNYEGAIRYFDQGLEQASNLDDQRMQAYCFLNLGRSYKGIQDYEKAEQYFKQVMTLREELGDNYGLITVELELAEVLRLRGDLQQALEYFNSLINGIDAETNPRSLAEAYNNISRIYLSQNLFNKAESSAFKAIDLAKSADSRFDENETLIILSQLYAKKGEFNKAFDYHIKYSELKEQLFSEENIRKIEQLKNQYIIEKQEAENEFLRKQDEFNRVIIDRQKTIIIMTFIGVFLLLVIAAIVLRAYVIRKRLSEEIQKQRDKIEKDKNVIQKQSDKLKELDNAKSRFFANVSHDLRSPLSLIIGNLEMLEEDEDSFLSPRAKKNLEVGFKNSKRLLYLTDEINDITRLEEGKINLKLETVSVNSYLKMLSDMFIATAEYKGVKMSFNSSLEDSFAFYIDPRQFEKIFYNLVSNALKFTTKDDQIIINVTNDGEYIIISFKDSGEGIDEESLLHVFDRFFQSRNNEYRSREGLGIGLALVKDLVELHSGTIEVDSTKGVGTKFTIKLKGHASSKGVNQSKASDYILEQQNVFRDLEVESKSRINLNVSNAENDRPTVLLVDDHPEIRYYIRQILEDTYDVLEAAHGIEAIFLMKEESIDIIITDLMMPWMDGFELIEAINANEDFRKIPLLVVSARISEEDEEKVLYKGINDYLQKPFSKKELKLRIENLLKQKDKFKAEDQNSFSSIINNNMLAVEKDIQLKLESVVKERIGDSNLSVYDLSDAMAASERQVYRLVKKITGLTPYEYITEVRMQYADYLIRKNKVKNATEAARSVGLKNVTTFSKQYFKKFGLKPSDLLNN